MMFLSLALLFCCCMVMGQDVFYLRATPFANCSVSRARVVLAIPLGTCLNNHDFSIVPCSKLLACLPGQFGAVMPYSALVNCTQAPSMHLSINSAISDDNELQIKVYPLVRSCSDIPLPLSFSKGACASKFAVSSACGLAGATVDWPDFKK